MTRRERGELLFRLMTAGLRVLPDFVIIGAQKGGTTSLYNYLAQHPLVAPAFKKETHFFDRHFRWGLLLYRAYFPLRSQLAQLERQHQHPPVTGEATPYYLYHPHAPARAKALIPQAKLIAVLRNPVDRAYSNYYLEVNAGREALSFEEAVDRESARLEGEAARMQGDAYYWSQAYQSHSYLARGIYVDQIQAWQTWFPREQMLILESGELSRHTSKAFGRCLDFLGLPPWEPAEYRQYFKSSYPPMDPATRARLIAYFEPHNRRLSDFLGVRFDWDR